MGESQKHWYGWNRRTSAISIVPRGVTSSFPFGLSCLSCGVGTAQTSIARVVQGRLVVHVAWISNKYGLFFPMGTPVAALIDQMTAAPASTLEKAVRLGAGYRITFLPYWVFSAVQRNELWRRRRLRQGFFCHSESNVIFYGLVSRRRGRSIDGSQSGYVMAVEVASFMSHRRYSSTALYTIFPKVLGIGMWNPVLDSVEFTIVSVQFFLDEAGHLCLEHCRAATWSNYFAQGFFEDVEESRFKAIIRAELNCM